MLDKPVTRRELLKLLLAASGGIAAASFLPAKWLKPVVNAGVLPVHARASAAYLLDPSSDSQANGDGLKTISNINVYVYLPGPTVQGGYKLAAPAKLRIGIPQPGVVVTMSYLSGTNISRTPGDDDPGLPRNATTDASGIADFGAQQFHLIDSFASSSVVLKFTVGGSSTTLSFGGAD